MLYWRLLPDARSSKLGPLLAATSALLLTLSGISLAGAAPPDPSGAPRKTRIRVRYEAPQGCRTSSAFTAALLRRTPRIELVEAAGADVLAFHAQIESSPKGFVGTLSLEGEERRADVPLDPAPEVTPPAVVPPNAEPPPAAASAPERGAPAVTAPRGSARS